MCELHNITKDSVSEFFQKTKIIPCKSRMDWDTRNCRFRIICSAYVIFPSEPEKKYIIHSHWKNFDKIIAKRIGLNLRKKWFRSAVQEFTVRLWHEFTNMITKAEDSKELESDWKAAYITNAARQRLDEKKKAEEMIFKLILSYDISSDEVNDIWNRVQVHSVQKS